MQTPTPMTTTTTTDIDGPEHPSETELFPRAILDRLISGIAHDLNNLTTAIRTSMDSLRDLERGSSENHRPRKSGSPTEHLDRIERAVQQSADLTNALASLGRAETQLGAATLATTVEVSAHLLRRALDAEVEVEIGEPTGVASPAARPIASTEADLEPQCPDPVLSDLGRLVGALAKLCGRAAISGGGIRLTSANQREIGIELTRRGEDAPDVSPHEDDLEDARMVLASCDATLPFSYLDGLGTFTASIRLPYASASQLASTHNNRRGTTQGTRKGRALIAEDHIQVRDALIDALSRCGFVVEAVADGDALVERGLASAGEHDIMVIDFDLPGRDGAKALEALRRAGIETPALMISGNIDFRPRVDAMPNTDFLQKPFGLADIREWATSHFSPIAKTSVESQSQ